MLIKVGKLSVWNGQKDVYISNEKRICEPTEKSIVLTTQDMDSRWLDMLCRSVEMDENGVYMLGAENRKYVLLYLIFSCRERFYFEDIMFLEEQTEIYKFPSVGMDAQQYYWEYLNNFMKAHDYKYKLLKKNHNLYNGKIKVPYQLYEKQEWLSIAGVRLFTGRLCSFLVQRGVRFEASLGKWSAKKSVEKHLKSEFEQIVPLAPKSQSGCLFFKTSNDGTKFYFVKNGTRFGADIKDEYLATKRICEKTQIPEKYVLPIYPNSKENELIFEFDEKQVTLKDILEMRALEETEYELLLDYFVEVLPDLKYCDIVHRDIHPGNVLVELDKGGHIINYRLIDFGCACIDMKLNSKGFINIRKNKYAGSRHRFSAIGWNDAASALFLLLQLSNINYGKYKDRLDLIEKMMKWDYTVYAKG